MQLKSKMSTIKERPQYIKTHYIDTPRLEITLFITASDNPNCQRRKDAFY